MARKFQALEIARSPELLRLAEDVQRTGHARLLRREGQDLAIVLPVSPRPTARIAAGTSILYPDLESLRGAAGSLEKPRAWKEMVEIAREDRFATGPHDGE